MESATITDRDMMFYAICEMMGIRDRFLSKYSARGLVEGFAKTSIALSVFSGNPGEERNRMALNRMPRDEVFKPLSSKHRYLGRIYPPDIRGDYRQEYTTQDGLVVGGPLELTRKVTRLIEI